MNWKLIDQWSVFFAGRLVSNCSNQLAISAAMWKQYPLLPGERKVRKRIINAKRINAN
jgi:hypothetical protein